uniref:Non-structural protein NS4 n=1 Tax=Betacoronavirus HKU24 TaxID=1590370 RepID=A0A866W161_9BETC|nr:non-structural protein NS4 [Betacoronavirus HKU24]
MRSDIVNIIAILVLTPLLIALVVGVCLLHLSFVISGLDIRNTTNPSVRIGTVCYTISTPPTPVVTSGDDGRVTLIKPIDTYTSVYLGKFRGFDTSTTGFKTPDYSSQYQAPFLQRVNLIIFGTCQNLGGQPPHGSLGCRQHCVHACI